ncbi:inorganic phosphate transporter [Actinobacteria bacterium YIM 96077]|uniref:Inorganic phosphate transporter n=1 Tax=Phytoactinopolyspora halophila TaxID=1981511 RepID=A0A329QE06_9ACTN|nr:inorganic phosphate transporter [Phytoactinopolyspora halophila]AYY12498.1 inorganic phosphate transporter [Actinobacteria bacterium YIM 96077]RAW09442.1 inorganic phosphate transporter [Phytoactinopolyspora halophila]
MPPEVLIAIAVIFAIVTGANDGGALIAPGLRVPALSVTASLALLTTAFVAYPLIVSTAVADTMMRDIVPPNTDGITALTIGFLVAVVVVAILARSGLPTSLTLAVIGGITGAGLGGGLSVGWESTLRVLAIGLAAPIVGALLGLAGATIWRALRSSSYLSTVRRTHVAAFGAQCLAYGANDGQKVLVLFLAASIAAGDGATLRWWVFPVMAVAFVIGTFWGLPRVARSIGGGIMSSRPTHTVTGEFAAAAAVLGSAAVGTPVSMTQSIAGGLLGAGAHDSVRRVRWRVVRNLGVAWLVTLPASAVLGAAAGVIVGAATG